MDQENRRIPKSDINFDAAAAYLLLKYKPGKVRSAIPGEPELHTSACVPMPPFDGTRFSLSDEDEVVGDLYREGSMFSLSQAVESGKGFPDLNRSFSVRLLALISEKGLKPSVVYKRAGIDKATFSRLSASENYSPTKDTAIALALAAELSLPEAKDLLSRAGFALSHSIKRDVLLEYCFSANLHDAVDVNILLDRFECKLLGRG